MTLNDILQWVAVIAILAGCIVYIVRRNRRRKECNTCDGCETPCPLKDKGAESNRIND